ncbi:aromatic compound dioxygenase [Colletotrichum scovillei]|nr:aromatic compound dioxygenase [Colletotrichum scovillei]
MSAPLEQNGSGLFSLPWEIREKIYEYYLSFDHDDFGDTVRPLHVYFEQGEYKKPLPPLMVTCKRIYRELHQPVHADAIMRVHSHGYGDRRIGFAVHGTLRFERLRRLYVLIAMEYPNWNRWLAIFAEVARRAEGLAELVVDWEPRPGPPNPKVWEAKLTEKKHDEFFGVLAALKGLEVSICIVVGENSLPRSVRVFYEDAEGHVAPYPAAKYRIITEETHHREMMFNRHIVSYFQLTINAIMAYFFGFLVCYGLFTLVIRPCSAHGTVNHAFEIATRQEYSLDNAMNLAHCNIQLENRGYIDEAVYRRAQLANSLGRVGITMRDIDSVLSTDHEITDDSVNWDTPDADIFATRDDGCVLSIETTEGPFYVEGELDRFDLTDGQSGIPMYLDLQIIDTETCKPVPDIWVEVWHTNSTGIYSGVVSKANGAGEADPSNADKTFHRGLRKTNANGAVWFGTNLPGHYSGRTPHIHIMTHVPGTERLANGTIRDNVATHAGQLFLDQKLVDTFRKHERYAGNEQAFIENKQDYYFRQEANFTDPVMSYVLLDHEDRDIEKGVMAWKLVGVNMTNVREIHVANTLEG